jgi:hypothetical protein
MLYLIYKFSAKTITSTNNGGVGQPSGLSGVHPTLGS